MTSKKQQQPQQMQQHQQQMQQQHQQQYHNEIMASLIGNEIVEQQAVQQAVPQSSELNEYRTHLQILVASGRCREFLNKQFTLNDIDNMTNKDVIKYYKIYESVMSARVSDTVSSTAVHLYSRLCGYFFPIGEVETLESELKNDYILMTNLSKWGGWLSLKMGPAMSLLTAGLITVKNCKINGGAERQSPDRQSPESTKLGIPRAEASNRPGDLSEEKSEISKTN